MPINFSVDHVVGIQLKTCSQILRGAGHTHHHLCQYELQNPNVLESSTLKLRFQVVKFINLIRLN